MRPSLAARWLRVGHRPLPNRLLDLNDPVSKVRVGALGRLPLLIEGVERLGLRHDEPQLALWRRRHGVRILAEAGVSFPVDA